MFLPPLFPPPDDFPIPIALVKNFIILLFLPPLILCRDHFGTTCLRETAAPFCTSKRAPLFFPPSMCIPWYKLRFGFSSFGFFLQPPRISYRSLHLKSLFFSSSNVSADLLPPVRVFPSCLRGSFSHSITIDFNVTFLPRAEEYLETFPPFLAILSICPYRSSFFIFPLGFLPSFISSTVA